MNFFVGTLDLERPSMCVPLPVRVCVRVCMRLAGDAVGIPGPNYVYFYKKRERYFYPLPEYHHTFSFVP